MCTLKCNFHHVDIDNAGLGAVDRHILMIYINHCCTAQCMCSFCQTILEILIKYIQHDQVVWTEKGTPRSMYTVQGGAGCGAGDGGKVWGGLGQETEGMNVRSMGYCVKVGGGECGCGGRRMS